MAKKKKGGDLLKFPVHRTRTSAALEEPLAASSTGAPTGNTIASKLVAMMRKQERRKVVQLDDVVAGRAAAGELQKTVATKEGLADLHPAHAAYVYAQNQVSVMAEQLTGLEEMAPSIPSPFELLHDTPLAQRLRPLL